MEIRDVRNLQDEFGKAISDMVTSFEAETGCFIEEFVINRQDLDPWLVDVDVIVEI